MTSRCPAPGCCPATSPARPLRPLFRRLASFRREKAEGSRPLSNPLPRVMAPAAEHFPRVGLRMLLLLLFWASPIAAAFTSVHRTGLLDRADPEANSTPPWRRAGSTISAAEPDGAGGRAGSEPWRTPADPSGASETGKAPAQNPGLSESGGTATHPPDLSEPRTTTVHSPNGSEPWRKRGLSSASEPLGTRALTLDGFEQGRTEQTPGGSDPVSIAVHPLGTSEPGRTGTHASRASEPERIATKATPGSESTRTEEENPSTAEPASGGTVGQTSGKPESLRTSFRTGVPPSPGSDSDPATGNSHQLVNRRDTEKRSPYHNDSMYISTTFTRGGDRTLLSVTNTSTLESVTSNISSFPISTESFAQTGGQNVSKSKVDIAMSSGNPLSTGSSRDLTYSSSKNNSLGDLFESTGSLFHKTAGPAANTTASFTDIESTSNSRSGSLDALQSSSSLSSSLSTSSLDSSVPSSSSIIDSDSFSFLSSSLLPDIFSSIPTESSSLLPLLTSSLDSSSSSSWLLSSHRSFSSLPASSTSELLVSSSSPMLPLPSSRVPSSFSELLFSSSTPSLLTSVLSTSSSPSPLLPSFSSSTSLLPSSTSEPVDSFHTNGSLVASEHSEKTVTLQSSTTLFYSGPKTGNMTQRDPYQTRENTSVESTVPSFFLPDPTQLLDISSSDSTPSNITEGFVKGDATPKDVNFVGTTPFSSTVETRFSQTTQEPKTIKKFTSTVPHTTTLIDLISTDKHTAKGTTHRTSRPESLGTTTDYSTIFKTYSGQIDNTSQMNYSTILYTPEVEISTVVSPEVTEEHVPNKATEKFSTMSTVSTKATAITQSSNTSTTMASTSQTTVRVCSTNPCLHQGACLVDHISSTYRCECLSSWNGRHCETDVDECLSNPCPSQATCINTQGSFTCKCSVGYQLQKGTECSLVRTFIGHIILPRDLLNSTSGKYSELHKIEDDALQMLNASLVMLDGYYGSSITETRLAKYLIISIQNLFSVDSSVAASDVLTSVKSYLKACRATSENSESCQFIEHVQFFYQAGGLCSLQYPDCDNETSECTDTYGIAQCQCKPGYFKYNKLDRSCRACEDGYKRENGTCVKCPFGFGGFNCGNPYQLITVVLAAAGGGLLLILATALAVTCCSLL
uniref:Protein HEG homolog 1 isoform X2 n=1 Tax=Geotrypetes seraphini TaxID=260995 RepID=A0A6P8QQB1_GEOSA|nr:protein HEG homolog 1 isoform X2 [Geotrypetes seraphini]